MGNNSSRQRLATETGMLLDNETRGGEEKKTIKRAIKNNNATHIGILGKMQRRREHVLLLN